MIPVPSFSFAFRVIAWRVLLLALLIGILLYGSWADWASFTPKTP